MFSGDGWVKTAAAAALAGAGIAGLFFGGHHALGWLGGAGWNLLNIGVLERLGELLMQPAAGRRRKITWLLLAKFGLLYPAGIALLWSGIVPAVSFACGFTAALIVMTISFLGERPLGTTHE